MTFLLNTRRAFFIVSVTIVSSCNKNMFKPGEYTNHEGQHLMLRADSVFEFFYYSYNNMIYSSGKFTVNDNKIHIISDSANFPIIEKVITETYQVLDLLLMMMVMQLLVKVRLVMMSL